MDHSRRMINVGGVAGVVGVLMYIVLAIFDPYIGPETKTTLEFLAAWGTPKYVAVNMALHFLFAGAAILWLVAFVGINRLLGAEAPSVLVTIGMLLGIVACAVMVQMMIVQGSVMSKMSSSFSFSYKRKRTRVSRRFVQGLAIYRLWYGLGFRHVLLLSVDPARL